MYQKLSAPITVQWELTPWCIYSCEHCYNYWLRGEHPKRRLTLEQLDMQHKIKQELIDNKVFRVTLTGGEPLGVLEQTFPMLLELKEAGIGMSMNTNLALLNERNIALLKQLGIRSILTSLMSSDPKINDEIAQHKGAYKKTVVGIKLAIENGFRVTVNMVVSKKNLATIYTTGKLSKELEVYCFCATKASKPSNCDNFDEYTLNTLQLRSMFSELLRVKDDFDIAVDSLEHYPACIFTSDAMRTSFGKRNCSAAKTICAIGFEGFIRPCSRALLPYGNITETGLLQTWQSMGNWRDGSLIPSVCSQACGEFPANCGGGCRVEALNESKKLNGIDPYSLNHRPISKKITNTKSELPTNAKVILAPNILFRTEEFGYIAYRSSSKWVPIDTTLYAILQGSLEEGGGVKASDLEKAYGCSSTSALGTLNLLHRRKIVNLV